jgi:signal recognition particle subunit SEC65
MKADPTFSNLSKSFWAAVRSISQEIGYTVRRENQVKTPTIKEIRQAFEDLRLNPKHIGDIENPTELGNTLLAYYEHRANILNNFVEPRLMDAKQAKSEFDALKKKLKPNCPLPLNKQKGKKKAPAYFTGIINMLIEAYSNGLSCDYDPRELTTVTKDGAPLRTLARRVDGAFPGVVNPIAIWEIKEYYYTTTFGSRVADGVYETLLDGLELEELREHERLKVLHYLMLDAHYTWWDCGKSYLCRIVDMLHMGYADEVLFGHEVIECLPSLVKSWVALTSKTGKEP